MKVNCIYIRFLIIYMYFSFYFTFIYVFLIVCFCNFFRRLIPGTKKLDVVNTSRSFVWNGSEVLKIAGQGALYILTSIPYSHEVFQVV